MDSARILVVDDEDYWRETILRDTLERAGYAVETAAGYREALDKLPTGEFALAVVDMVLVASDQRKREGLDLLKEIHQLDPTLPCLVLSAWLDVGLAYQLLTGGGACDIIEKDKFRADEFLERVKDRLRIPPAREYFLGHGFTPSQIQDLRPAIEKALRSTGLRPYFADQEVEQQHILKKIREKINHTQFSVFDISLPRPNVFIELGMAVGLNRPFLVVHREGAEVPKAVEKLEVVRYAGFQGLIEELAARAPGWIQRATAARRSRRTYCYIYGQACERSSDHPGRTYLIAESRGHSSADLREAAIQACQAARLRPTFLGAYTDSEPLLCQYCRQVHNARFALFDICSETSADIYIALGLAIGLEAPHVLLVERGTAIPSNLQGLDSFQYAAFTEIQKNLANRIGRLLGDLDQQEKTMYKLPPLPVRDIYSPYEAGVQSLLEQLGPRHPKYNEALTYQQRLRDNLAATREYGDTEGRRAERAEIVAGLNALSREVLGVEFNKLVAISNQ